MIPLLCGRARRDAVKSLKIYNVDDGIHGFLATALRGYGTRYHLPTRVAAGPLVLREGRRRAPPAPREAASGEPKNRNEENCVSVFRLRT